MKAPANTLTFEPLDGLQVKVSADLIRRALDGEFEGVSGGRDGFEPLRLAVPSAVERVIADRFAGEAVKVSVASVDWARPKGKPGPWQAAVSARAIAPDGESRLVILRYSLPKAAIKRLSRSAGDPASMNPASFTLGEGVGPKSEGGAQWKAS